jgi:hypothetical protein
MVTGAFSAGFTGSGFGDGSSLEPPHANRKHVERSKNRYFFI